MNKNTKEFKTPPPLTANGPKLPAELPADSLQKSTLRRANRTPKHLQAPKLSKSQILCWAMKEIKAIRSPKKANR